MVFLKFVKYAVLSVFIFVWFFCVYKFPSIRLFIVFLPIVFVLNVTKNKKIRNISVTVFIILWCLLFHYESTRHFFLNNITKKDFPKTKFLFPPAGWIMFYTVDDRFGFTEVYGVKEGKVRLIDPHEVFQVRTIMYDNIHRNILSSVSSKKMGPSFCGHLQKRFPQFESFSIAIVYYPSLINDPDEFHRQVQYQCVKEKK
jgi:hypothetical protein